MRPKRVLLVAIPAALLLAAVAVAFFSAQRTLTRSAKSTVAAHDLGFTLQPIDLVSSPGANPAFELVASPPSFTAGAFLDQDVYLAGPAGLSIYAPDGSLRQTLRTGVELPVEPIVAVASGRPRGASDAEILLATSGAGLLLLEPARSGPPKLRQLLPAQASARDLTALLLLPSGDLLLGTRHAGVLVWDGAKLSPFRFNLPGDGINPATLEVTALAAPDAASLLIGTRNAGLFYSHAGTVRHVDAADGLPDRQIEALLIADHKAYVGTPLGVAEFDLTADVFRPQRILARGLFSHALAYDSASRQLAVGTLDQSVQRIALNVAPRLRNASIVAPRDVAAASTGERIDAFVLTAAVNAPLFAIADGALVRQSGGSWSPVLNAPHATLADRNISALAFAPDGSLYAGFFDHGLDIVSPDGGGIRHLEDDHLFCINRLMLDPVRQTIAAATANGIVLFDRQGTPRQTLTRHDGLISDHVTDLAFTRAGMTIATPAGLTFAGSEGMESLYAFQGLVNNHVYSLAANGTNDRLLAGTLGGISLLEANTVRRNLTVTNSGLKHNWVTAIAPFAAGYLVGTYGAGIQQLAADGSFRAIDLPAGVPHDLIINPNAIFVAGGHVYAGTLDHGMLVYSAATGRWSNITRGLPSLNVTAFAERNGELYIGTENGLVRINEARLEAQLQ